MMKGVVCSLKQINLLSRLFSALSFLQVTCNCFTISDGELQEIGVGLYPR